MSTYERMGRSSGSIKLYFRKGVVEARLAMVELAFIRQHIICSSSITGDPDDRTLRKIEMNAIVPELMRKRIDAVECRDSYLEMMGCIKREGQMVGMYSTLYRVEFLVRYTSP